jgi:hypothetical protein
MMNVEVEHNGGATKQAAIASALRQAVAAGEIRPGDRLPIRTEIESRFDASRMTVQKALDTLARDAFVYTRGRLGTFIADHPPCLCRYAIVFPQRPQQPGWGGYYEALQSVGHEFGEDPAREVAFYYGVDHWGDGDYDALLEDIQSQRLAGILFAGGPWNIQRSPIVRQDLVPCMAMMSAQHTATMQDVATICFDGDSLFELAIQTLTGKGCRRPAILIGKGYDQQLAHLRPALAAHDLSYDPTMLQGVALEQPELAEHVTALWMRLPEGERPDGIFVADDNLVDWACSGLLHAGVRPGVDMPVAVHTNFPTHPGGPMPLDRIGYNIRALVQHFIETTDARRRGDPFEQHTPLLAIHEEDIETTTNDVLPAMQPESMAV